MGRAGRRFSFSFRPFVFDINSYLPVPVYLAALSANDITVQGRVVHQFRADKVPAATLAVWNQSAAQSGGVVCEDGRGEGGVVHHSPSFALK